MPLTSSSWRHASLLLLPLMATAYACSSSGQGPPPVASLSEQPRAQAAFQDIRERWLLATPEERASLEPALRAFQQRFAEDPTARVAGAYLGIIALHRDDLAAAEVFAKGVQLGPPGNTRDLGVLLDGVVLWRRGKPSQALDKLTPLVGKLIDPFAQQMLYETVVGAAVDAKSWFEAVAFMNEWVHNAELAERAGIRMKMAALLAKMPPEVLEVALQTIQRDRDQGQSAWEREVRDAIAQQLGRVAVDKDDPRLAQRVIATSGAVEALGEAVGAVAELATSGGSEVRVTGASIGVMLPTADSSSRQLGVEALTGVLEVLGPRSDSGTNATLMTQDSGPTSEGCTACAALARSGASILIGGFDPQEASAAAAFAEREKMSVILLVAPEKMPDAPQFSFVLGASDEDLMRQHLAAAKERGWEKLAVVGAQGEPPLSVACSDAMPPAGQPRYPVREWQKQKIAAVAVTGPHWCARDVLLQLFSERIQWPVLLGLQARGLAVPASYGGPLFRATAANLDTDAPGLAEWRARTGSEPSWFEALGRDAATLASDAVAELPASSTTDLEQIRLRRTQVRDGVQRASSKLWTSQESRLTPGLRAAPRVSFKVIQ